MPKVLKVGTRGSRLAIAQTEWVVNALRQNHPNLQIETVIIRTKGDVIADRPLREVAGKGFFVKEIEIALLRGEIDFAVHSLKDMPTDLPEGLTIAALCNRIEPKDVLVVKGWKGTNSDWREVVKQMPKRAKVGTSSLRRQAQIKNAFPNWQLCELRGNVDTRLRKLDEGEYDAIVVAAAGLIRLGLQERISCILPVKVCCPAAGQGALAIEARCQDEEVLEFLKTLDDFAVRIEIESERSATKTLGAGCHSAVGALARLNGHQLSLCVVAAQPDGQKVWRKFAEINLPKDKSTWLDLAKKFGSKVAKDLLEQGAVT
ncbi:MAG: hydroxymethylbilane synthase [Armatimonadetes bacterium]|nr:hydroxymethylbilane synthase [Armatimonadota bacterium]MDW8028232.1 hydroxymethylbilane synthase [Armatimonadota bacterium]